MEPNGLCQLSLRDLARLLGTRELSAREVMAAHLEQIRHWNPHLNAIVAKLDDEACLALAEAADGRLARGAAPGALHWAAVGIQGSGTGSRLSLHLRLADLSP